MYSVLSCGALASSLFISVLGLATASSAWAWDAAAHSRTLVFQAPLNEASVSEAIAVIRREQPTAIKITSRGGSEAQAARLGWEVKSRKIAVKASRYCLSACVIVLLSSPRASILDTTFVAAHPSNFSAYLWASQTDSPLARQVMDDAWSSYEAIRRLRLSREQLEFLSSPFQFGKARCARILGSGVESASQIYYDRPWWIPTIASFRKIGISVEGFWPQSADEAFVWAQATLGNDQGVTFAESGARSRLRNARVEPCDR